MMESESVIGIYSYVASQQEMNPSAYYLSYVFDERGLIDRDLCWKVFRQLNFDDKGMVGKRIGPFESMENLNQFIYSICQEMDAAKACLLSVVDYNKVMEEQLGNASEIVQEFLIRGNCIENVDRKSERGIINKLFRS